MSYILVVDDEKDIRDLIGKILIDEGHTVRLAKNSTEAMNEINDTDPSLIILDIWLKDSNMDGIEILKNVRSNKPSIPVVIISGHGNIKIAVAAVKQGAYDFIEKPFNIDQLLLVKDRALEASKLRHELIEIKRSKRIEAELVGKSSSFKTLKSQLDKVSKSNGRVLLTGPQGSGKEISARYIYLNSQRVTGSFVSVPCSTIDNNELEQILFGYEEKGTIFKGSIEKAHGGVLFLDEVADLSLEIQSKILRVLIDKVFRRLNGKSSIEVDLRIISSTSKKLENEISIGNFREELFHRLNVVPIKVPSLEERREDISILSKTFLNSLNQSEGLVYRNISDEALAKLQTLKWPGNVRQLKNTIERVLILGQESGPIMPNEIPDVETENNIGKPSSGFINSNFINLPLREAREVFEREYLITQIERFSGNISRTAQFVGMERSALHRKIKTLDIGSNSQEKI